MKPIAYSYIRFSSDEQNWGDSKRRQTAAAARYASKHGLALDDNLTFQDLGVSAFRGRNSRAGALGSFLTAIELGIITPGSFFLVESFDRLSRDHILPAQALFLQIIQAGIVVVTLIDGRVYSADSINSNPYELLISLVAMMRANEESAHKSSRLNAAWRLKRKHALVKPLTSRCPAWLRLDPASRTFEILPHKAEVVQRIFKEASAGHGLDAIAKVLNQDRIPLMSGLDLSQAHWQSGHVARILNSRSVTGTLIPHKTEYVGGKRVFRRLQPIPGYYPAIIDEATYYGVQALRSHRPWTGGDFRIINNIFARLAHCHKCNGSMRILLATKPYWRYLVCSRGYFKAGCQRRGVRYPEIEDALVDEIDAIIAACPWPRTSDRSVTRRLRWVSQRLGELEKLRADHLRTIPRVHDNRSRPLRSLDAMDAELEALKAERLELLASEPRTATMHLEQRLNELRIAAMAFDLDRRRVNMALRALFSSIIINYEQNTFTLLWHHGGRTRIQLNPDVMAIKDGWKATSAVPALRHLWGRKPPRRRSALQADGIEPPG